MKKIDELKKRIYKGLIDRGLDERKAKFASYAFEEILLLYNSDLDSANYEFIRKSSEFSLRIEIPGNCISVRQLEENNNIYIFDNLIKKTNFNYKQEYYDGKNIITLTLEKYFTLFNNIKFAFNFLNEDKTHLFIGYVYNIIAILINISIPIFTGKLILAYSDNALHQAILMATAITVSRILYLFFISKAAIHYNVVSFDLSRTLQTTLLKRLFSLTDESLEKNGSGQFIRRINSDVNEISSDVAGLFNIISNGFYYLGVLIISFSYDKYVFLAELITFIGLYYLENHRTKVVDINRRKVLNAEEKHSSLVLEQIYGSTEVKLLNASNYFIDKTKKSADDVANLSKESNRSKTILSFINNAYIYICYLVIMIYLGYAIYKNMVTIPDALILFNFFTIISTPLVSLIQRFMNFKKTFSIACERCFNLLEGNEFAVEIEGNHHLNNVEGKVEFKNVTFAYETEPGEENVEILHNVDFVIEPNTTTAIVGKSGSGKTTVLKLITGQRNCNIGTVEIDGVDIQKISKNSLRENMSIISQSPFFFNASIKENLLLVKPDATDEELIDACKKAYIYDDIMMTEHGFDTNLNEKGVRFSGGQRQRLAIARAMLKGSKFFIFDEATSALDNIVQEQIMNGIKNVGLNHTIIIVAHRLSSIINSDKILVLDRTKVICQGSHKELLKTSKEYQELYKAE